MRKKVTKLEAELLIKKVQLLYSFLNVDSKEKLLKSFRNNPLKELIERKNLDKKIKLYEEKSSRIFFDLDEYYYIRVYASDVEIAIKNCRILIQKELRKEVKNFQEFE
jgi:hypothetical protein